MKGLLAGGQVVQRVQQLQYFLRQPFVVFGQFNEFRCSRVAYFDDIQIELIFPGSRADAFQEIAIEIIKHPVSVCGVVFFVDEALIFPTAHICAADIFERRCCDDAVVFRFSGWIRTFK